MISANKTNFKIYENWSY